MIFYPLYLSIPGHHMFPAFLSVPPFVPVILSVQQILSRPRWKSKLIKKGCMGWTWSGEHVLLFAIKQLWEDSFFQVYFLNCIGRKNFLCTPHEKKPFPPPSPCQIMTDPYQVLPGVPGPTIIAFFFAGPSLTEWFRDLILKLEPPFFPFCPCSPLSSQRNQNLTY